MARTAAGLELLGIDIGPALAQIGLSPEQVRQLAEPIPLHWLRDFWNAVVRSSGQTGLGLLNAELVRPEAYDVFGCLIAASGTLGEAALRATRLIGLATSTVRLSFYHEGDRVTLAVEPFYPELVHRETIEFMVGTLHVIARRIAGRSLPAIEVCFTHERPPAVAHYERFFAAPVRFGAALNGVIFDAALLDIPVCSRDPRVCAALQRQAEELMESERMLGFKAQVRAALARELRGGDPSVTRVAAALELHRKTLSRRLRTEGTSFRRLRDELRMQLARRYLSEQGLSVEEVAFLLGYSERSAFHRAYRRWTGHTPRADGLSGAA